MAAASDLPLGEVPGVLVLLFLPGWKFASSSKMWEEQICPQLLVRIWGADLGKSLVQGGLPRGLCCLLQAPIPGTLLEGHLSPHLFSLRPQLQLSSLIASTFFLPRSFYLQYNLVLSSLLINSSLASLAIRGRASGKGEDISASSLSKWPPSSCSKVTTCLIKSLPLAASKGKCPTRAEVGSTSGAWHVVVVL